MSRHTRSRVAPDGHSKPHPLSCLPSLTIWRERWRSVNALLGGKDDGSFAWIAYGAARSSWRKEKFAKTFPNEKRYRHSLQEEADALRSVLAIATGDKQAKKLSTSLAKLKKLNDEGLLEAYILMALADEGIAADHPAYLRQNRDKLRQYVTKYVLAGGGK